MKKSSIKKLSLKKNTLTNLGENAQAQLKGGIDATKKTCQYTTCCRNTRAISCDGSVDICCA
jgi:hypothetical protein